MSAELEAAAASIAAVPETAVHTPAEGAPGTATPADSTSGTEDADLSAALSALRGEEPAKPAEPVVETPVAEVAKPVEPVATPETVKPVEVDADTKAILAKMARLEFERDQLAEKSTTATTRLAELESHAAELAALKADPLKALEKLGFTPDQVLDYVTNGPKKVDPVLSAQEKRLAELEKMAASMRQREEQAERNQRISQHKASIPQHLESVKDKYPLALAYHETPAELADAIWSVQEHAYLSKKQDLTVAQAADVVESTLRAHKARFDKSAVKPAAAAVVKPVGATLTNAVPTQATAGVDPSELDDDAALSAAVAALKGQ